jgi:hypothetical protein
MDVARAPIRFDQATPDIADAERRIAALRAEADELERAGQDVDAIRATLQDCLATVAKMVRDKEMIEATILRIGRLGNC